jgi:phage-related minor tail protein
MAEKIKISDLFDFSDVQDLETLYKRLEQINKVYKQLANNINQESKTINKGLEENVKEVEKLATALKTASKSADIKKLSDEIERQAQVNKKLTTQNEKLTEQNKKLKESQKAVNEEGKEATRLLKQQEQLKAKISKATGEEAKQNAILKLELQRVNKEVKEQVKQSAGLENAYQRLVRQTREAKNEAKRLGAELGTTSVEFLSAQKNASKLDKELKELDASVGDFQRNVGNYSSALDGIGQGFESVLEFATPAGLALAAGALAIEGIGALAETVKETNTQLKETAQLTQLSGDALIDYTSRVRATAKTFDQEYKEVLTTVNQVTKEFGLTSEEALDLINQGFARGANINDNYLDQLREFGPQFTAAGLGAKDLFDAVAISAQQGFLDNKFLDTIKESGLALRELTKAQVDALAPLGESRTEAIKAQVEAGNSFKAIQLVAKGLNEVNLTASQSQTIIADVFKGAGEDLGKRGIEALANFDQLQKEINANLTEQQKQQLRILEVENELANAEVRLGEAFKNSGKEISIFFKQLQTLGIEGILEVIDEIKGSFDELTPLFNSVAEQAKKLFDFFGVGEGTLVKFLKILNPITFEIQKFTLILKVVLNVLGFVLSLFNDLIDVASMVTKEIISFARSFELVNFAINQATSVYKSFLELFSETPKILNGVGEAFSEFFSQVQTNFKNLLTNFVDEIKGVLTLDLSLIQKSLTSQADVFISGGTAIAEAFKRGYNEGPTIEKTVTEDVQQANKVIQQAQKQQAANTATQNKQKQQATQDALTKETQLIQDEATKRRLLLKEQRTNQLITEEEFQDQLLLLQLETLEKQKEALEAAGKSTLEIEEQINDILLQEQKRGEQLGLKQQQEAAKESLRLKKAEEEEKLRLEREAREERQAIVNDPITQGLLDGLESKIDNEFLLAGAQALRSALEQGSTPEEALKQGLKVAGGKVLFKAVSGGFHDGGYTGDGGEWDAAGIVHKGEFVTTKKQTNKYGLDNFKTANDFDTAVETGYFNQFAKTNHAFSDQMNLKSNIVVNNDNTNVVEAIKELPNKMPTETLKPLAGHLQHQQKIGNITRNTTFKNTGRTCR